MLFAFKMDRRLQDFLQKPLSFPQNTLGALLYLQQWESHQMSQIRSGDSLQLMLLVWGRLFHPRIWDRRRISHQPVMFSWRPDELQHAKGVRGQRQRGQTCSVKGPQCCGYMDASFPLTVCGFEVQKDLPHPAAAAGLPQFLQNR